MLERISLGQTRFSMPGVAPDARGIVLGKLGVLSFPSLDGVVSWLRLYSDEDGLDDLLPGTHILRARTPLGSRAFLLVIPAASSYILDRAARCARLAGGATYTGTSRHFVRYRDERSPYGYDVGDLGGPGPDMVLHGEDGSIAYARDGEVPIATVVFRLSLRRVPGAERLDAEGRALLYISVAAGLAYGLLRYLLRARVRAEVATVSPEDPSAFTAPGEPGEILLVRAHDVPERLLEALRGVPGVTLFRPASEHIAVEVGWAHPVALSSVASLFPRDRFYLFFGAADRLEIVRGPIAFSGADHLLPVKVNAPPPVSAAVSKEGLPPIEIPIRLIPTLSPPRRVVASLVDWSEAARLKQLVYVLPPPVLRGHEIALTDRGLLLLCREGVDVLPLGALLTEAAPGLLIPLGMDVTPRVPTEVLGAAIEHQLAARSAASASQARITVFPHDGAPFFVASSDFQPLERRALARIRVPPAASVAEPVAAGEPSTRIVNDAVGRFALWGFPKPPSE
ncbi:MAG TPA: hypothetical protein VKE22_01765 [Haliangiales bacterium]|nr:hypothetical protein [Haliangiales bacterium]